MRDHDDAAVVDERGLDVTPPAFRDLRLTYNHLLVL